MNDFTDEQKRWLEGFTSGLAVCKAAPSAAPVSAPTGPDALQLLAQERTVAAGGKLVTEEVAKRTRHPLDRWNEVVARAEAGQFPKGVDVFLAKYHGLFYVAPAQDSFMCRLRMPNGILNAWQMRGLADAAERLGGGYADVTTRANLQIREIAPENAPDVVERLMAAGIVVKGSGADNIRNVTGSPTAGIDAQELLDTRPLARSWHNHILNDRSLFGLPRSSKLYHAEPFGPIDSIVVVDSVDELIAEMNVSNGNLVASVATDDAKLAQRMSKELRAFKFGHNKVRSRGDREEPFGGIGASWKGAFVGGRYLVEAVTEGAEGERLFGNFDDYTQLPTDR